MNLFIQFIKIKNLVAKACVARKPFSINKVVFFVANFVVALTY